jgi:hypothetical protein
MKTSQEQILQALSGLIPGDAQKQVSEAVSQFLENALAELEEESDKKLEESYKEFKKQQQDAEVIAEQGYGQAWDIICDLRDRLELQKEEFDQALEEGYEEAYQMLQEERAKNDTLEVDLYEEYDKRLNDIKEFMIDKIDTFLSLQGEKYYEMAKRDVRNDPTVAESTTALDRILEVASEYLSDEDYTFATSSRLDAVQKQFDEQKAQLRILEAKNMRLATDNTKLNEALRESHDVINESVNRQERKARIEKAKNAQGRGKSDLDRQVVLGEWNANEPVANKRVDERNEDFVDAIGQQVFSDWKYLSGINKKTDE